MTNDYHCRLIHDPPFDANQNLRCRQAALNIQYIFSSEMSKIEEIRVLQTAFPNKLDFGIPQYHVSLIVRPCASRFLTDQLRYSSLCFGGRVRQVGGFDHPDESKEGMAR
ncbi:hypothetical protein D9757_001154 [Collybiopsis confluens]|uniref:Uncharacterized protein n=1 Tax=Collybiopsis confluens TaxID=2823264 RepID=A0A8H5MGJ1_9AGAR|nr:hypothetical protein D9757_001154 [Collybiopsis confluens]